MAKFQKFLSGYYTYLNEMDVITKRMKNNKGSILVEGWKSFCKQYPNLSDMDRALLMYHNELSSIAKLSEEAKDDNIDLTSFTSESIADVLLPQYWEDWHFKTKSPNVVFLQCKDLLINLWNSKFEINECTFEFPFSTFMVAVPKGTIIEGIEVPSFLVIKEPRDVEEDSLKNTCQCSIWNLVRLGCQTMAMYIWSIEGEVKDIAQIEYQQR